MTAAFQGSIWILPIGTFAALDNKVDEKVVGELEYRKADPEPVGGKDLYQCEMTHFPLVRLQKLAASGPKNRPLK